jgi:threonylcarbamoyladenosine tRNA methylthiotransferase MtaB
MDTTASEKYTRVAFYTLGCKLNQAETESLVGQFREDGYQVVLPAEQADIYIINTCTITHVADSKSRHALRAARRRNPHAIVIAIGCYAHRAPHEFVSIADVVVNNEEKPNLLEIVKRLPLQGDSFMVASGERRQDVSDGFRIRSLVKVQDGCSTPCTYCIVPRVRTYEYSVPIPQIIKEIRKKVSLGYKEIVLTGTKIGCYRDNSNELERLIDCILSDTDIRRIRLSSLQAKEITPQLLALWRDNRLCRHFHLALQSGSNTVLHRMRRRYSVDAYQKVVRLIKKNIADVAITTDIMVGFPGESSKEFEESYLYCKQLGFAAIHVFPFSIRLGTEAADMSGQIDDKVKKERAHKMLELANYCRQSFYTKYSGRIMSVLWEKEIVSGEGIYSGLTDNYIRVFTRSGISLTNRITLAKLERVYRNGIWAEIKRNESSD